MGRPQPICAQSEWKIRPRYGEAPSNWLTDLGKIRLQRGQVPSNQLWPRWKDEAEEGEFALSWCQAVLLLLLNPRTPVSSAFDLREWAPWSWALGLEAWRWEPYHWFRGCLRPWTWPEPALLSIQLAEWLCRVFLTYAEICQHTEASEPLLKNPVSSPVSLESHHWNAEVFFYEML